MRGLVWLGDLQRRLLSIVFGIIGPRAAYAFMEFFGRLLYRLLDPLRLLSEAQCQAALGPRLKTARALRIAEDAFVHRVWSLADLLMARRYLRPKPHHRYGGRIPDEHRALLLEAQRARKPMLLLTAYHGPFDLLPVFLGQNGLHAHVLYRRHPNAGYDALRQAARSLGGCSFVPIELAASVLPQILERGGTVAIVGDHHGGKNGLPVTFLGLPTRAPKTVGLLACKYEAAVVVAGIRRMRRSFQFSFVVGDVIRPGDWATAGDPLRYVTERYLRGLERIVFSAPEQYLWGYPRWGAEAARDLMKQHALAAGVGIAVAEPPNGQED
jgi:KDO2-lipid IV(A) lauroyltransferase